MGLGLIEARRRVRRSGHGGEIHLSAGTRTGRNQDALCEYDASPGFKEALPRITLSNYRAKSWAEGMTRGQTPSGFLSEA